MGAMPATAPARPAPVLTRAQARVVWSALAAALAVAVAGSIAISPVAPPDPALTRLLLLVVAVLTVANLGGASIVTAAIRRKAGTAEGIPREAAPGVQTIVASAMAIGAALFSCIAHFLTRDPVFLALVLAPAALLVRWYPSEARWARISPVATGSQGAQPARRMIRE